MVTGIEKEGGSSASLPTAAFTSTHAHTRESPTNSATQPPRCVLSMYTPPPPLSLLTFPLQRPLLFCLVRNQLLQKEPLALVHRLHRLACQDYACRRAVLQRQLFAFLFGRGNPVSVGRKHR